MNICAHTYEAGFACHAGAGISGYCASHWRAHTLDMPVGDLTEGDLIIELQRDGRTFGPGGLADGWKVADVERRSGVTLVTYTDGSQSALPEYTRAMAVR